MIYMIYGLTISSKGILIEMGWSKEPNRLELISKISQRDDVK